VYGISKWFCFVGSVLLAPIGELAQSKFSVFSPSVAVKNGLGLSANGGGESNARKKVNE